MYDQSIRGIKEWIDYICGCEFYEEISGNDRNFHIGQFLRGHIKYPLTTSPKVLELEYYDPENELSSIFKIADYDSSSASQRMRPIKQLNLRSTDRLYIVPGKIRTVILLRIIENVWMEDETVNLALCLPISSFKSYHPTNFILNIQLFNFPQYFYIKPSDKGAREESAARFDLIQYVPLNHLEPVQNESSNSNFMLSSFMLKLLFNHLSKFLFNEPYDEILEQEIVAFRDIMLSEDSIQSLLAEE
jgi:hypothetical protein